MEGATGSVRFNLRDFGITVEQNNIIGNILEEWLDISEPGEGSGHLCGAGHHSSDLSGT